MHRTLSTIAASACLLLLVSAREGAAASPGTVWTDTGVTFRVWAPQVDSVAVIGDFNSWQDFSQHQLAPRGDGVWTLHLDGVREGERYQFLFDGELRRRDPYARRVSPDQTHSVLLDPDGYDWDGDRSLTVEPRDLVLYELHIGSFHDPNERDGRPGTFEDAIRRLDHLEELGVNGVCVLPVHEFNGSQSWGYNPCDLFAVEQAYGGPEGFKDFVKACHERGIAVHLDIVHNHYGPENVDLLDWNGTGKGLWFYTDPGRDMTPWGPRVNFDEPMVRNYIRDNAVMWMEEYHVDGFRWDSTRNIRAYDEGRSPIPEGAAMLEEINRTLRARFPGRLSIAEDSLDIGNFHGSWDYDFHHSVMPQIAAETDADRDIHALASAIGSVPTMWRVIYTDNHDEAGKINGQVRIASDIDPEDPDSDKARRLSGLASLITLTAPGIPLLFMGNEFQESGTWHDDRPLNWGKRTRHRGLLRLHRDLIRLRRNLDGVSPGLQGRGVDIAGRDDEAGTMTYWRWRRDRPADRAVVAINLSGEEQTPVVRFPSSGTWRLRLDSNWARYDGEDRLGREKTVDLPNGVTKGRMRLAPYSGAIFTLRDRPAAGRPGPDRSARDERDERDEKLTMYMSVNLAGTFNDWDPAAWPMRLVSDYVWERHVEFDGEGDVEFKIAANGAWSINWGGAGGAATAPFSRDLTRGGGNVKMAGPLRGVYTVRFDEQSFRVSVTPAAAGTEPARAEREPGLRTWTKRDGQTVRARFVKISGDRWVILETQHGSLIRTLLEELTAADRRYVRRVR